MRYKALAVSVALGVSLATAKLASAVQPVAAEKTVGWVTATFGNASIQNVTGKRAGDVHAAIQNKERITTDGGGISVLLASRVVLKIDAHTSLSISESTGQTGIVLDYGTVHVYVGSRTMNSGIVCAQDPQSRTFTESGVYLISYDPTTKSSYYACEHNSLKLETVGANPRTVVLTGNTQATINSGKLAINSTDRQAFDRRLKSLDRLGETTVAEASQTSRVRARKDDMEQVVSQLTASGWIKSLAAPGEQSAPLGQKATTDTKGNTTITGDSPKSASAAETPALSVSSNSTPAAAPAAQTPVSASSSGSSVAASANATPAAATIPPVTTEAIAKVAAAPAATPPVIAAPPAAAVVSAPVVAPPPPVAIARPEPPVKIDAPIKVDAPVKVETPAPPVAIEPPIKIDSPAPPVIVPPVAPVVAVAPPVKIDPPVKLDPPVEIEAPAPPVRIDPPVVKIDPPVKIEVPLKVDPVPPPPVVIAPPVKIDVPIKIEPPVKIDVPIKVDPVPPPPVVIEPPKIEVPVKIEPPPPVIEVPIKVDPVPPPPVIEPPVKIDAPPPVVPVAPVPPVEVITK